MKMMRRILIGTVWRRWLTVGLCLISLGVSVILITRVYAAGIPAVNAMTYTGYLETPDGIPVEGNKNIMLEVFDAEIDGNKLCEVIHDETELIAGRFQILLPDECIEAIKTNPDLWLAIRVDGALIGRTKLGAVPYALEAGHATAADTANRAEYATKAESSVEVDTVPTGMIAPFYGTEAPTGWIIAREGIIDAAVNPEYTNLVDHLRTVAMAQGQSVPDDENKAELPDLRGMFLRGKDADAGVNPDCGDDLIGQIQDDELGAHVHSIRWLGTTSGSFTGWVGATGSEGNGFTSSAVGGAETRPKNMTILYIIKL